MDALTYTPNGRILVVDDNARALQAMSELLEFEGFSVLTAKNGLDALNKMRIADHISLVLLDLSMPVMDGWEVLRRKRSDAYIAEIPVVVLSAVPPVSLDGAQTVLKKPVDLKPLVNAVRRFSNEGGREVLSRSGSVVTPGAQLRIDLQLAKRRALADATLTAGSGSTLTRAQ
jgi:CheY-like chemotaxis protein